MTVFTQFSPEDIATPILLPSFQIVHQQLVLIAQIQLAIGDDWMSPCRAAAAVGLFKTSQLFELFGICCQQHNWSLFVAEDDFLVRINDGTFHAMFAPGWLAGFEFHAGQKIAAGAVDIAVQLHHSSVMILHVFCKVDRVGVDLVALSLEFYQLSAGAVV